MGSIRRASKMNTTEKAVVVGLGLVVAFGLFAGAAFGLKGQTSATNQRGGGGMMGLGSNAATTASTHSGGMMGGMWRMMGDHGLVANGGSFFMSCIQYMANYFGIGANGTAS